MPTFFSLSEILTLFHMPFLGGLGIALLSGPLGTLLIWQRLAYLGDALAHASLLGVGVSLLFLWPLLPTTLAFTVCLAFFLFFFLGPTGDRQTSSEGFLLLLTQAFMGIGLLLMSWSHLSTVDLMAYFVGDFLTLAQDDVLAIWGVVGITSLFVWCFWPSLLSLVIHPELAMIQGVRVQPLRLVFLLLTSVTLVFAIQTTGILLVTALLIFPVLTLRPWMSTPEQLCLTTSCLGLFSMTTGFVFSIFWDAPPGPLITLFLFCSFLLSQMSWLVHKSLVPLLKN